MQLLSRKKLLLKMRQKSPANYFSDLFKEEGRLVRPFFIFFFLVCCYQNESSANSLEGLELTKYKWVSSGFRTGQCFEQDRRSKGEDFIIKRPAAECRALVKEVITVFIPNGRGSGGRCYEVDKETQGYKYARLAAVEDCRPKEVNLQWLNSNCYERGMREDGVEYRVSKLRDECLNLVDTSVEWVASGRPFDGNCYIVDSKTSGTQIKEQVDRTRCRPTNAVKKWVPDLNDPLKGRCYELDPNLGVNGYARALPDRECLESTPEYGWKKTGDFSGICYQRQLTQNDREVPKQVANRYCHPPQTKVKFFKTSLKSGVCALVDAYTEGEQFKVRTEMEDCRPEDAMIVWLPHKTIKGEGECFRIDSATKGEQFVESISDENCLESQGGYFFELQPSRIEGFCYEPIKTIDTQESKKRKVTLQKCRPKTVKPIWIGNAQTLIGHCYEVDSDKGSEKYLERVSHQKCRPFYTDDMEYIFHRAPGETAGHCFEVDKKTQGLQYAIKVSADSCRKQLRLPDL